MPSVKWFVEPVFLCREPLPPDKNLNELDSINNLALVSLIKQLSSLSFLSNKLFDDITKECQSIDEKASSLLKRMNKCKTIVKTFNAKTVKIEIPKISDLEAKKKHFKIKREISTNLFTPNNRDQCLQDAYQKASISPLNIKSNDNYQKNCHSNFSLSSYLTQLSVNHLDFLDIERQKPEIIANAPKLPHDQLMEKTKSLTSQINLTDNSTEKENEIYVLPSPKERAQILAQEYPSSFVPIDITGSNFQRMHSFRRSLIYRDSFIKRKKVPTEDKSRRNTICANFNFNKTRANKNRQNDPLRNKIDNFCQTEASYDEIYKTGRVIKLNFNASQMENKCILKAEVHREDDKSDEFEVTSDKSPLFLNKKMNSFESLKVEKPKNIKNDFNLSNNFEVEVKMREASVLKGAGDDGRSSSGNWSATSSTHASVDSDQNIQASAPALSQTNEIPLSASISSIGKDSIMSESVTTQTENEKICPSNDFNGYNSDPSTFSIDHSKKKIPMNDKMKKELLNENASSEKVVKRSNSKTNSVRFANRDSDSWLKYFESSSETIIPEAGNGSDIDVKTPKVSSPAFGQDCAFSLIDDEAESVYSVDNDGYYTSMHTDSGLFKDRLDVKLLISPNSSFRTKSKRDSISSVSTIGDISINSILSKTDNENTSEVICIGTGPKIPPCPPIRISSIMSCKENSNSSNVSQNQSPLCSNLESDASDVQQKLKIKTLKSTGYLSLCNITSESSDPISSLSSSSIDSKKSERKRKLINTYKTFKDIFHLPHFSKKTKVKPKLDIQSNSYNLLSSKNDETMVGITSTLTQNSDSKSVFLTKFSRKQDIVKSDSNINQLMSKSFEIKNLKEQFLKQHNCYHRNLSLDDSSIQVLEKSLESKIMEPKRHSACEFSSINLNYHPSQKPFQTAKNSKDVKMYNFKSLQKRDSNNLMNYQNSKFCDQTKSSEVKFATLPTTKPRNSSPLNLNSGKIESNQIKCYNSTKNYELIVSEKINEKAGLISKKVPPTFPKPEFSSYQKMFSDVTDCQNFSSISLSHNYQQKGSQNSKNEFQLFSSEKKNKFNTNNLLTLIQDSKKKSSLSNESNSPPSTQNSPRINSSNSSISSFYPGDRRSWSYFREFDRNSIDDTIGSRRSLALDRFGRFKSTTISDFKKLLAQARQSSNFERKSAVEILQISNPSKKKSPSPTLNNSNYLTMPFKANVRENRTRIVNGRFYRSPYRLESMYPPIKEVVSEENLKKTEIDFNLSKLEDDKPLITLSSTSTNTWV